MLATTPEGDAYTFAELEQMLSKAGFQSPKAFPLLPVSTVIMAKAWPTAVQRSGALPIWRLPTSAGCHALLLGQDKCDTAEDGKGGKHITQTDRFA